MAFDDANNILNGPRSTIVKFEKIGDSFTGILLGAEVTAVTNPQGEVQFDKNGNEKKQIVYTLQGDTIDPEIEEDDGKRRVFAKWAIQKAISEHLAETGLSKLGLQEGGRLTVTFTESKPSTTRGFNNTKLFTAEYTPPPPRQLATGTKEAPAAESPWGEPQEQGGPSTPLYTQEQQDLAFSIYNANPQTDLAVISAATKIAEADLKNMFTLI